MPRVRYTGGGVYRVAGYGFEPGSERDVDEELAEYLEDVDGFERVEVTDVEFTEVAELQVDTDDLEDKTVDELSDLAAEAEITGRSSMTKDELIAALREE